MKKLRKFAKRLKMNRYNKGFPEDKKFKMTFRLFAKMDPTEPVKRLKFGFIFFMLKMRIRITSE